AVYLVVAWRVLYLTMQGRRDPSMSCDVLFEEEEWRAAYTVVNGQPAPEAAPSLGEMIDVVARLGGHTGRKPDCPPGPKVMWLGLQRLMDLAAAWRAFGPGQGNPKKSLGAQGPRGSRASPPTAKGEQRHKKPPNSTICVGR